MCGIVGYVGSKAAWPVLIDGLKRLEYRGYDSCGVAVFDNGVPRLRRTVGRVANLETLPPLRGRNRNNTQCGIGHTRWATHGRPSELNAHPHGDCYSRIFVVHNGIIENHVELRKRLLASGHQLRTETDTEVLPHLIETHFRGDLQNAVRAALREVVGHYGLAAICLTEPDKIVVARNGPPIVLGLGATETFVASDVSALLPHTREFVFLNDGEIASVSAGRVEVRDPGGTPREPTLQHVSWNSEMAEKQGFQHFMLKEIFEQPSAVRNTLSQRLHADGSVNLEGELGSPDFYRSVTRIYLVACGTSLHAAMVGRYLIESLAQIPVEVECASEFRYRNPLLVPNSLTVTLSQSGETADTLGALEEARRRGSRLVSICNVVGSMAARQSDHALYTHAGPEIGVASTKAFTSQLAALYLLALQLGTWRGALSAQEALHRGRQLAQIPDQIERTLDQDEAARGFAELYHKAASFLFLGRGISAPIALEGALKLKEISYIHAEGFAAGEMKHGPIALVSKEMPVIVLSPCDPLYRKTMSNIEEVKVRDGRVLAIATEGDTAIAQRADHVLFIPPADSTLHPLLSVVPLQLFAYHAAALRGCDIDKPRNLAKSVTVE
jgi:glutamine---fructose-6-phosphate transaminase (isomerizing)